MPLGGLSKEIASICCTGCMRRVLLWHSWASTAAVRAACRALRREAVVFVSHPSTAVLARVRTCAGTAELQAQALAESLQDNCKLRPKNTEASQNMLRTVPYRKELACLGFKETHERAAADGLHELPGANLASDAGCRCDFSKLVKVLKLGVVADACLHLTQGSSGSPAFSLGCLKSLLPCLHHFPASSLHMRHLSHVITQPPSQF